MALGGGQSSASPRSWPTYQIWHLRIGTGLFPVRESALAVAANALGDREVYDCASLPRINGHDLNITGNCRCKVLVLK